MMLKRKKTMKDYKKKHDFLEVKRKKRKLRQKKTFITTQLLL